jgi:uncharacterized Zn finger protein (UPF0148 family)
MKAIKNFESWKNNIIDNTLFKSGRAKYDPQVTGGKIKYKTSSSEPYYFANISKKNGIFVCNIYKKKIDSESIRIKRKKQDTLKNAHNYVREFLNQKLKKTKKEKDTGKKEKEFNLDELMDREERRENRRRERDKISDYNQSIIKPKRKTILRRFA